MICTRCGDPEQSDQARVCTACAGPLPPPPGGERRRVTIWMADLCGYTRLNEVFDPEEVAAVMERIEQEASRVVLEHGGIINQFVGDEIVALFGVPTAHEDDARRAVSSVLELHAFVRRLGAELQPDLLQKLRLHTGIHSGLVLAEPRDPRHGLYSLRGDTINVVARLRSLARPDEILVSESTHRSIAPFHLSEPLEAMPLRGRAAPVVAYRLVGPTGAATPFEAAQRRGLGPLVGRIHELEILAEGFERACAGEGRLVTVSGQSGVGKSRLLHELRRRVEPRATVFFARCEAYGKVTPYQAFLPPLRQVLGIAEGDAPAAALESSLRDLELAHHQPALAALLGLGPASPAAPRLVGEQLREVILRALVDVFLAVSRRGPVVLLLEDWHWADEGSTTAAAHLAGSLGDHPILMVISHRPSDAFVWGTARARAIPLTPLTLDETGQLAESLLGSGAGLPGWLADAIYQHTGGNAFFVEQVCRALVDSLWDWKDIERLGEDKRRGALPIPDTVQAVLRARIDSLDAGDAEILRLASILGTEFPLWQLELLIGVAHPGEEALAGCMRRLASVDLLYAEGDRAETYRFKHAITQEVAYETLRRQRRRELHACAAKGIERANADALDGCCEALAYHYAAGEDHAQAARYAERAGDKAARTFSLEEARQQYRQALASLDSLEPDAEQMRRRIDVALKWAAACMFKPARDQLDVLGVSLEHARRLGHQAGIAYTLCWFGCIEYALGDQQRAVTTFAECMALANQLEDERLLAQLHLNIGQSHAAATEYGKAFEHLNEGLARKERGFARRPGAASAPRGVPAGSGRAYALGYLGLIHGDLGHFEQAQRYLTEALSLVREARSQALEGSILTQLALVQLWQGRWAAARATAKLMQGTAEQIHGPYILAMSKTVTGYASLLAGDGAEALELLRGSVAWLETTQIGLTLSWNQACLAEGLALRGHDVEARVHAWRALARADARDLLGEAAAHRALGLAEGRPDGSWHTARGCFETAIELAERKRSVRDVAVTRFRGAALALRFSEFRLGAEWLTGAIAQFAAMEMTWYREQALDLLRTFPDEAFCPLGRPAAAVDSSGDFETAPAPLAPADQKRNAIVPGSKK